MGLFSPPCWRFCLSTGACRLLGGAGAWCQNDDLWDYSPNDYSLGPLPLESLPPPASPAGEPQPTPASSGDLPKPTSRSVLGSCGVTALLWVPGHLKLYVRPPRVVSLLSSVLWSSCTQAPLAWKAKCSEALPPDFRPQAQEPDVGLGTLPPVEETL